MEINVIKQVGEFFLFFALLALVLFLPAGTLSWLAGWIFLFLFFVFYVGVTLWLIPRNPGLVEERMHLGTPDQKAWDKVLFTVILVFPFAWLAFVSLDATRFHWSPIPIWLQVIGGILLLSSFYLLFLVFRENSYLSPVVRVQQDRGHSVVSTGPYHYVRHPMYSAIFVFVIGTSLLLGSLYGVLLGLVLILLLARRAILEERTLREELEGYADYMTRVKYRLVPYVW
jgi:protein-S-isoprenylcysteine O-methyltransferase Ste14